MKPLRMTVAIVGAMAAMTFAHLPAASAQDFSFSFDTGNVAFAYSDGYWDNGHQWHKWRNERERKAYQARYTDHYNHWRHTRDKDNGWHDRDHDHDHDHDHH